MKHTIKILLGTLCLLPISTITMGQVIIQETVTTYTVEAIEPFEPIYLFTNKNVAAKQKYNKARMNAAKPESWEQDYADFKTALQNDTGLSYTLDVSLLGQRGAPNGDGTSWQFQAYPTLNWELFDTPSGYAGSIQASYTPTRYWGSTNAQDITDRIDVVSGINDYTTKSNSFDQLTYTQAFGNFFSMSIGQFPIYNFDGSSYDANQQQNFLNFALSQNASNSYPVASLGAYFTFTFNPEWTVVAGMQDANNITGATITTDTFDKQEYTSFASVSYTPTIKGMGVGQYSLLVFNQPSVMEQHGTSNGYSVNFSQSLNDTWAVFARLNGVENSPDAIKQSYVLGGVMNNPLKRNPLDQIGFATAINKLNEEVNGPNTRAYETVLETYWAWGFGNMFTITPDLQFYINPGLDKHQSTATVASIRTTLMF